jgi:DNA-binding transcriptional regulator YdaS (Cro superfamily)
MEVKMSKKPKVHPLRRWRLQHGMTQKEMAEILGIHWSNVTYWETGSRPISPYRAIKLEKALGIKRQALRPDIFGG